MTDDTNDSRMPVIFMGKAFYEILKNQMDKITIEARLKNYENWIRELQQMCAQVHPYIPTDEANNLQLQLKKLQNQNHSIKLNGKRNPVGHGFSLINLDQNILKAQIKLYTLSKELILRTGGQNITDIDLERARREMQ